MPLPLVAGTSTAALGVGILLGKCKCSSKREREREKKKTTTALVQTESIELRNQMEKEGTANEGPYMFVGTGEAGFVDGDVGTARFNYPYGIAIDGDGNSIVVDRFNHAIRKVTPEGMVTTLVGNGNKGFIDGNKATARFNIPTSIALDGDGNFIVADTGNSAIRKVTPEGYVTTLAGSGGARFADGNGSTAAFHAPVDIAVDRDGNFVVVDRYNHAIRKVTPEGVVSTLAGNREPGFVDGDGASARFNEPCCIAVDGDGNFIVADFVNHAIRKVTPEGIVSTLAGNGEAGFMNGGGKVALFNKPVDITVDGDGNFVVADSAAIRKVTPRGNVTTLVETRFWWPHDLTFDLCGNLIGTMNHGIVKVVSGPVPSTKWVTFMNDMYKMMKDTEHTDVVFMVGEEQEEVRAHGLIIKARSDYFEKMLNSRFREGQPRAKIFLPEVTPRAFRAMLTFLYINTLDIDDDIAIEVAQLADQYCLSDLTEQVVGYCQAHIHSGNATLWLDQADQHGLSKLRAACLDYVCKRLSDIKSNKPQTLKRLNVTLLYEVVMRTSTSIA
eukprot:gnl/MRDRNA2_/MRDRNA2_63272_c0_seq2.p1 gnl/MRDRNA2_/MRDRNA2_63272_c0~~gnl/MRDRNA2_/MRDRNA2_63272_c0_seq2.p1  ORF type:complete len:556 (+),score=115.76 gnl/MRDRNA2_/MRDRNA2_63272_c0_seq2:70-1737(+)